MREVEHFLTSTATAIVHDTLGKHTDKGALARIDITDHCNARIVVLPHLEAALHRVELVLEVLRLLDLLDLLLSKVVLGLLNGLALGHSVDLLSGLCCAVGVGLVLLGTLSERLSFVTEAEAMLLLDLVEHILEGLGAACAATLRLDTGGLVVVEVTLLRRVDLLWCLIAVTRLVGL